MNLRGATAHRSSVQSLWFGGCQLPLHYPHRYKKRTSDPTKHESLAFEETHVAVLPDVRLLLRSRVLLDFREMDNEEQEQEEESEASDSKICPLE